MARQLRVEYPGAIYHVTCRMVGDAPSPGSYGGTGWPEEQMFFRRSRNSALRAMATVSVP